MELLPLLPQVEQLTQQVGKWLLEQRISPEAIETKSLNNFVTFVDKGAEEQLVAVLSSLLPSSGFIAEEGTGSPVKDGYNWIIDPLDGTTNFLHQVPVFCISIALHFQGELLLGVIHDPNRNETFSCAKGHGATCNGNPIHVSTATSLADSLLATGFPYDDFGRQEQYLNLLGHITKNTRGVRRLGSAALDLAYVACGRCDLFYEYALNPWDVAAGILLVQEAGGTVSDFQNEDNALFGKDILASNSGTHQEMLQAIERFFPPALD